MSNGSTSLLYAVDDYDFDEESVAKRRQKALDAHTSAAALREADLLDRDCSGTVTHVFGIF